MSSNLPDPDKDDGDDRDDDRVDVVWLFVVSALMIVGVILLIVFA